MFKELIEINKRPKPFEYYTASDLWAEEYTSQKMLEYHLNESIDVSSRNINFINRSAEWIINHFNLDNNSELIDFGCGPGLYTSRFAKNKIKVTGVDFSKRSIEYAKQTAKNESLNISYIHANYLEFESPNKYDLVTMIMCDYCALSHSQRNIMLNKFKRLLKPNGAILLDVYSINFYNKLEEKGIYEFNQLSNLWSADDYYSFQNTFKYDTENIILDKYTIIEKSRKRVVYNWLQCYSIELLKDEFEEQGLQIVEVFSDVAGSEYKNDSLEFAIVAKIV